MNEAENADRPIYALADDKDNFQLFIMSITPDPGGSHRIKRTPCTEHNLYEYLLKTQHEDINSEQTLFYLSCLVITGSEKFHRYLIQRITKKSSRNITTATAKPAKYLRMLLIPPDNDKNDKMDEKISIQKIKEIEYLLNNSFVEIISRLGFPQNNHYEYTYQVNPEVISSASDPGCVKYLKQFSGRRYISKVEFNEVCKTLKSQHTIDAENVIGTLKLTKTRNHLAALSISTENDQVFISMVNDQKCIIKMESWKFLKLLENSGEPLRLHEFEIRKSYTTDTIFQFNHHREGVVVGKFDAGISCLWISCLTDGNPKGQASFILDLTYTLCMYVTLKRLEEDKHRFSQLLEDSTMAPVVRDPFEHLTSPFL